MLAIKQLLWNVILFTIMVLHDQVRATTLRQEVASLQQATDPIVSGCTYYSPTMTEMEYVMDVCVYYSDTGIGWVLADHLFYGAFVLFTEMTTGICYVAMVNCGETATYRNQNYCAIANGLIAGGSPNSCVSGINANLGAIVNLNARYFCNKNENFPLVVVCSGPYYTQIYYGSCTIDHHCSWGIAYLSPTTAGPEGYTCMEWCSFDGTVASYVANVDYIGDYNS